MKKLSLGCGKRPEKGFIGLDSVNFGWNVLWKAGEPFVELDNEVEFIKAYNFFEHIDGDTAIKVLNECWRVLKKNCELEIVVPKAGTEEDFSDPTHKSHWTKKTFESYIAGHRPRNADYGIKPWSIQQMVDHPANSNCLLVNLRPNK